MMKAFVGFAGFGGVDIALRDFGFDVIGVEIDDAIADVNRFNGGHCVTADILTVNPADYSDVTLAHFSPVCTSYSIANYRSNEGEMDVKFAKWIVGFIETVQPRFFTLENVGMYRKGEAWRIIRASLGSNGYGVGQWYLNAADYGVPQTRKRMMVAAERGQTPIKPFPTHLKKPDMFTQPWQGWYDAIEDLIPELPETKFAPWQMRKLPKEMRTVLVPGDNTSNRTVRAENEPMVTVQTRDLGRCPHRAFIPFGKVVSMTTRCLARFQNFPDNFTLPENRNLACKGIGGAVPPKLYEAVLKSLNP